MRCITFARVIDIVMYSHAYTRPAKVYKCDILNVDVDYLM